MIYITVAYHTMHYSYITWIYKCDTCQIMAEVASDKASKPSEWKTGYDFEWMRQTDYNLYIVNLHKDFCPKCAEKIEIREVFK